MLHLRTILHPTDFSACSDSAFHAACSLARAYGAELVLVHVAAPAPEGADAETSLLPHSDEVKDAIWNKLSALRGANANVVVSQHIRNGEPTDEILRLAAEINADMIVIGTHGRTGLGRLLMGSVAEEVIRKAVCPVLTVKIPVPASPE
jgi:nucleotide-binding universal stress UspA family protein